ncbi:MAG: N-6 DNA methylase [Oscillospiraceae bacterium]
MATVVRGNERSFAIDIISQINSLATKNNILIKKAGGEKTISTSSKNRMFPDVILYSDKNGSNLLQGWELKMPDTLITDETFIKDAQRKANALNLNSCFIWNFTAGVLYIKNESGSFILAKQWNDTDHIKSRADVEIYRNDWQNAIEKIIFEINNYLIRGEIKSSTLGDIISDTMMAEIVSRNKLLVADKLKEETVTNSILEAFIDEWWHETKNEYLFDESSKFTAYAKVVLLNWTNRIVFAHIIKKYHNKAFIVEKIVEGILPADANIIFEEITKCCDFYNVFKTVDYNTILPELTWNDFLELNCFLTENENKEIEQSTLQTVLEKSVSTTKRELAGQFTTPTKLAEILVKLTTLDWTRHIIDPCCGTGSIIQAALKIKKDKINISDAISTTWASDKYSYPLQVASIGLTSPETINEPNQIFQINAMSLKEGQIIHIVNPTDGNIMNLSIPKFSSIVSNLPFIPFESLKNEDINLINDIIEEVVKNTNITLSGRSDIYCFIPFALYDVLEDNGRMGIIVSNSWLGTVWGKEFHKALQCYFNIEDIHISGKGRWFNNAMVVTTIIVLSKKEITREISKQSKTRFLKWNKSLDEINSSLEYQNTIVQSSLLKKDLDKNIISMSTYSCEEISCLQEYNISLNALFHNVLWVLDIKEKLIPLKDVFEVFRGERRGWDAMFFPESGHNIENIFIKKVLKNARKVKCLKAEADSDAFCCGMTVEQLKEQGFSGALKWIEKFENGVNNTGKPLTISLKRANMHWYEMQDTATADIFTTMNPDKRLFFSKFEEPTFINQRLIGLKKKSGYEDVELYHALLNSIVGMFYIEAIGFGRGLGALDINKESIKNTFMLNPNAISNESRDKIVAAFANICSREIQNTLDELVQNDRKIFDLEVLKAFGIDEYYDSIKDSLISIQKSRLSVRSN